MTRHIDDRFEFEGIAGRVRPGDGPRLLWLHGYTLDVSSWEPLWDLLPHAHHVGIDLPGHGQSAPLGEDESLETLGRKLHRLCAAHQLQHLVAVSYGTITALQIVIEQPRWFSTVTLGAPALAGGPRDPGMERSYMRLFQLAAMRQPAAAVQRAWLESPAWEGVDRHPELKAWLSGIVARHPWPELRDFRLSLRMIQPPQSVERLRGVTADVLVLIGEHEMPAYRETAGMLAESLPHCVVRVLPGVGHLCLLEAPRECAALVDGHVANRRAPPSTGDP